LEYNNIMTYIYSLVNMCMNIVLRFKKMIFISNIINKNFFSTHGIYFLLCYFLIGNSLLSQKSSDLREEIESNKRELEELRKEIIQLREDFQTFKSGENIPSRPIYSKIPQKNSKENNTAPVSETKSLKKYDIQSKGIKLKDLENNQGKRYAIAIGINRYQDSAISELSKARNDAKIVGKILREQGQFDQVYVMTDDIDPRNDKDGLFPTKLNIEEKLDSVLRFAEPEDLIVFFFSGHGISDPDENGYLVSVDAVMDKQFNTTVKVEKLVKKFQKKRIKKSLLVLDACRDVLYTTKSSSRNSILEKEYSESEVAATFYSTKAGYYSYEDDETDYGVFTKYMVMGLEGKADMNGDGVVAFSELEQYVQKSVKEWSTRKNKQQKPYTKIHGEKTGDLALSFSIGKGKASLTEKPIPIPINRTDILLRSTFVPGWGQYYAGEKIKGVAYGTFALGLGGYFFYNVKLLSEIQAQYSSTVVLPGSDLFYPSYLQLQTVRTDLLDQEKNTLTSLGLLAGFWVWNLLDAGVLTKIPKQDFFTLDLRTRPSVLEPKESLQAQKEVFGSFQFTVRF
jgi:cell division protein FtsB